MFDIFVVTSLLWSLYGVYESQHLYMYIYIYMYHILASMEMEKIL